VSLRTDDANLWSELRASRSAPPPAALADDERRRTYLSALEQAEQMFRAAAAVGPATRPLLVFYGLSQAGRAIAAASSKAATSSEWQLLGHGIKATGLAAPVQDVAILTEGSESTSFGRLSWLLQSPTWQKQNAVALGDLWDTLPENRLWPLVARPNRRTALEVIPSLHEPHPLASAYVAYLPPEVVTSTDRETFERFMKAYPGIEGYTFTKSDVSLDAAPEYTEHVDGWGEVVMHWQVSADRHGTSQDHRERLLEFARPYGNSLQLFPSVGQNSASLHPILAWWAILFALSMLARYQPAEWVRHIDVDSSEAAVPIERILSDATTVVPRLLAATIREVSSTRQD
jgi:hypothetical protein